MHISEINIYPVKSLKGFSVDSAELKSAGLQYDRQWMVVEPDGTFITQRTCPQMALVETAIVDGQLVLSSFGMPDHIVPKVDANSPRLKSMVWDDSVNAVDTGDETAEWLNQALGVACRLVCFPGDETRQCNPERTNEGDNTCLLYTSPSPRDGATSRMPSSA